MRPGVARPDEHFLDRLHQMLGDDAIPACGWCEDGITIWFDWLAMDAYDNKYFGQWFMVTQLSVIRLMNKYGIMVAKKRIIPYGEQVDGRAYYRRADNMFIRGQIVPFDSLQPKKPKRKESDPDWSVDTECAVAKKKKSPVASPSQQVVAVVAEKVVAKDLITAVQEQAEALKVMNKQVEDMQQQVLVLQERDLMQKSQITMLYKMAENMSADSERLCTIESLAQEAVAEIGDLP